MIRYETMYASVQCFCFSIDLILFYSILRILPKFDYLYLDMKSDFSKRNKKRPDYFKALS